MNRNEKRHPRKEFVKTQTLEEIAIIKAGEYITNTAKTVKKYYFDAMRSNGISEIRAKKIAAAMEDMLKAETDK